MNKYREEIFKRIYMLYILCSTDSRSNKENYIDYNMIDPYYILSRINY